jgi:polyisoprenyl-phosphate glycosyltransferase
MKGENMNNSDNHQPRNLSDKLISITAPAFNEEENVKELCESIRSNLTPISENYEIVLVDNGSTDQTLAIIKEMAINDARIKYVSLSRNFGHQGGLLAGMHHCLGDIVITMDADLQHPPKVLPELLDKWCEGYDVVGTTKRSTNYTGIGRIILNNIFYKYVGHSIGIPLSQHQSDFRLLDKTALNALLSLPEKEKFIRGLTYWIGFRQTSLEFEPAIRMRGKTKFNFLGLITFAIHGLVSFSSLPLRIFTIIGLVIALAAFINAGYFFLSWIFNNDSSAPPGWWTLAAGIYFLGGLQLVGIGVIGEYLAQNLIETRRRPSFIVKESTASSLEVKVLKEQN